MSFWELEDFNELALEELESQEYVYLLDNGWVEEKKGIWSNKRLNREGYDFGHAVNSQKWRDRQAQKRLNMLKNSFWVLIGKMEKLPKMSIVDKSIVHKNPPKPTCMLKVTEGEWFSVVRMAESQFVEEAKKGEPLSEIGTLVCEAIYSVLGGRDIEAVLKGNVVGIEIVSVRPQTLAERVTLLPQNVE